MKWAALAARILVGLPFVVLGLQYWLKFIPMDEAKMMESLPEAARTFSGILGSTHYMDVVKALEVVGGLLVLSGRLTPLGLVLATPVAVNIALWDALILKQPGLGVILTGLCFFLVYAYRSHFAGVFSTNARVG
jgi:uncharacterized membrane protein YphA (DoxX/SURF4 family)